MKLTTALLITSGILIGFTTQASACGGNPTPPVQPSTEKCTGSEGTSTYTFSSGTALKDLEHSKAYLWGINWKIPTDETITAASITFNNINNWTEEKNALYVNLLNSPRLYDFSSETIGVKTYKDPTNGFTDKFDSNNTFISDNHINLYDYTHDPNASSPFNSPVNIGATAKTFTYTFTDVPGGTLETLISYLEDDKFGLGFDPDCHFSNNGIDLKIATLCKTPGGGPNPVPEPATMLLLGTGLIGLVGSRSRKRSK